MWTAHYSIGSSPKLTQQAPGDPAPRDRMPARAGFAERWRVRQLARLCATIADAVDSTRDPEPLIYETHQIEMFTGEPQHGANP